MFDEKKYTEDSLRKQLLAIQLHGTDGSALEAGCNCIPSKHTLGVELFSEEGIMTASNPKEKAFYLWFAEVSRKGRKSIEDGSFEIPHNPTGRAYEPHGLTECEKTHPHVLKKLSSCIRKVERREGCTPPYTDCPVNPVAVCRASVKCP